MTTYPTAQQVETLHNSAIESHGGTLGVRDRGALESAVAQPQMTFGGQELYPLLAEKAGALAFSLVTNHPFVDGNKRVGHAAMAVFLKANGNELTGTIDDHEAVFLALACGTISRRDLAQWIKDHMQEVRP